MTWPGIEPQSPGPLANTPPVKINYSIQKYPFVSVVGDSPMTRMMNLPKENINQELSW